MQPSTPTQPDISDKILTPKRSGLSLFCIAAGMAATLATVTPEVVLTQDYNWCMRQYLTNTRMALKSSDAPYFDWETRAPNSQYTCQEVAAQHNDSNPASKIWKFYFGR